jgi:tRNA pseudouridine55 synthase
MNGLIVIDKQRGITSHGVVREIRRLIPGVKAGHTGTLDPIATGVLPVCLGKATRLAEYTSSLPKTYRAGITFGIATDTGDADGKTIARSSLPILDPDYLEEITLNFTGRIEQIPPVYSAVKYQGKPAYYWARRGKTVPLRSRTVEIYEIKILSVKEEGPPQLTIEVRCSAGTYIRTLAVELSKALKVSGHLSSLCRLAAGNFSLKEAHSLDEVAILVEQGKFDNFLLPMDSAVKNLKKIILDSEKITDLQHGRQVRLIKTAFVENAACGLPVRVYDKDDNFKAIASFIEDDTDDNTALLKTNKFFDL